MNFSETNGVICDKNGSLLFYSNGVYIANALNDTMQNGSGLNPCQFTTNHTEHGLTIPQANLILPVPGDSTKFYLFHETSDDYGFTYSSFYLYYSIIDLTLDGGLGAVTQKNVVLLNETLVAGRITACKHANGRDWWLVVPEYQSGNFYKFLITPQGILGPYSQNMLTPRDNYFGQAVFSQKGNKYAYYESEGDLDIFDFDRCSGFFYNRLHIDINDSAGAGGAAFSAKGRYLYISSTNYVYQFDLMATDIPGSQTTIAIYDGHYAPFSPAATVFYLAALAPDNKIYINSSNSTTALHVINNPDSAGLACDLCQHCISLPSLNAFTMPNHPNYFLGAELGSVCDSLTNDITSLSIISEYKIFPNPTRENIYISNNRVIEIKSVNVFNSIGQNINAKYLLNKHANLIEVNTSDLSSGVYFIELLSEKVKVIRKFIKE
jgi:hypothetical protein